MPLIHKNKRVKTWTHVTCQCHQEHHDAKMKKACNLMFTLNILGLQRFKNSNNGHTQLTKMDF
jgi:hypothetical protein